MQNLIRNRNFYLMLSVDACLIVVAYSLAYLIRFEGQIPDLMWRNLRSTIWYLVPYKLFVFMVFRLYKGMWRYTSLVDMLNVVKATTTSSIGAILAVVFIYRFEGFPRSVFILDWILTFILIAGVRVTIRIFLFEKERGFHLLFQNPFSQRKMTSPRKKLLIIGAGDAGEKMLREIMDNPRINYEVVGFVDDDPKKKGKNIHGVPVLGPISKVHDMALRKEMDEILVAIPSVSVNKMRGIIEACESTGLKSRTTPGIGELINGKVSFKTIREVSYEDLLGRDPIDLDMGSIGGYLKDKVVLVSGAGGSIGSELCRQIAQFTPKNLVLMDKTENNLFNLEMEFRQRFPRILITPILGDVKFRTYLNKLFDTYRPQVLFHAAAYKHVPIVELNPWEAVFNNVIGTKNIVEASYQFGAERFIMVSTDKAVRPINVMGVTKRVAEMITSCYALGPPHLPKVGRFVTVRFGNVIGSEGSVVHLFKKQIERFGPVTVTHPEITRYFMTIPEACKLILQAGAMGEGGEIFILDMGTPIKIVDMAKDLIHLSGFKPDLDIEIKFIGLRPGEKLHEELSTEAEGIVRTSYEKIFVLKGNTCDLNWLNQRIEELLKFAYEQNAEGIKKKLKEIVPEYVPFDSNQSTPSRNP